MNSKGFTHQNFLKKNLGGFTLTELLVVIFIITILSSISFAYYRRGGREFALSRSAFKLAQDIRRAQEMAMSVKECQPCGGIVPKTGYGIVLDTSWDNKRYRLYADTHGNDEFFTPFDTIVETINLESGVVIKEISLPPDTYSKVSINFMPPDPKVNIKFETGPPRRTYTIITLSLVEEPTKTKTITVNKASLIEIE